MITLNLIEANGALYPVQNKDGDDKGPVLEGFVEFNISEKEKLNLKVAAWTRKKEGSDPYYSLSIGGMNGALFKEETKKSDGAPDYTGTMGANRELRIAAWRKQARDTGAPYISLSISVPSRSGDQKPKDPNKSFL